MITLTFYNLHFYEIHCGGLSSPSSSEEPPLVCTAQYITGAELPVIQDLYTRKAQKMIKDCSLCYRIASGSTKSGTKRLLNRFYPQAIRLLNS